MLNRTLLGGALALAVLAGPMAVSPASAHPAGPAKCWAWAKHHWVWVCKRHHYAPIYQPYFYDPYYDPYFYYQPYYGPSISFFFGNGGMHHHHHKKNW